MSRLTKVLLISFGSMIMILGLIYLGLAYYYAHPQSYTDSNGNVCPVNPNEKCFYYGVNVNNKNVTGKSVATVNEELATSYEAKEVLFKIDKKEFAISLEDIFYKYDYKEQLTDLVDNQNAFLWYENYLGKEKNFTVIPKGMFNEELFDEIFKNIDFGNLISDKQDIYIELTKEDGYVLVNGKGRSLDTDKVREKIKESLKACEFDVYIPDDCFTTYEYTKEEEELFTLFDKLDKFQSREIAFRFGKESRNVTKYELCELLCADNLVKKITPGQNVDNKFQYEVDEDRLAEFVDKIMDPYNTYHNKHFITHSGAEVLVTKGNYGNTIDLKEEEKEFVEFFKSERNRYTRTPKYLVEKAKYKELNDFGDTFIEVSIDEQKMWYYVDGKIYVETDITSGSMVHGGTDPRVVYVYNKIPGKWLNGPTWHNWVDFWVPIEGSIGIHDASWRSVYGGNEYKYNGSHGCINTPREAMEKLYDRVEIGTLVIVYSIEKNGVDKNGSK